MNGSHVRLQSEALTDFCVRVFTTLGVSDSDADVAARVLVAADQRGIPSHGTGRLGRYVGGLRSGQILPQSRPETLRETPTSLVVNANGAMGAPVSAAVMDRVIAKAQSSGAAFAAVRESTHFGIAGYYAMQALPHDMIGIAMTNTAALGVPTFGREVMFGTNPIAFAAPADRERAFVLDMSTTVVTQGKLEVYRREGTPLPAGWAVNADGRTGTDPGRILDAMLNRLGGGILPLGGEGTAFSGHKGFGLAIMVDILCAVLAGAPTGPDVVDPPTSFARVSHFFGAIKIDTFRKPAAFRADMDQMLARLRESPPAEGEERVYFAGLPEFEREQEAARAGVPLLANAYKALCVIADELNLQPPTCIADEGHRP